MPRSSLFGVRAMEPAAMKDTSSQPTPVGRRAPDPAMAAPAHRGGRHHMAQGPAALSQMMPSRPAPMAGAGASAQAGGRHHYGEQIRRTSALQGGAPSEEDVAEQVIGQMFGALEVDDDLFDDDLFDDQEY